MDIIKLVGMSNDSVLEIFDRAKRYDYSGTNCLKGKFISMLFLNQSTRSRIAAIRAVSMNGGSLHCVDLNLSQLGYGEHQSDVAAMLGLYSDVLIVRDAKDESGLSRWIGHGAPVINALNLEEHPTQAIGDLVTISKYFDGVDGLNILYVGPLNNTAKSLIAACNHLGVASVDMLSSEGDLASLVGCEKDISVQSRFSSYDDILNINKKYDVVYCCRWSSMGLQMNDRNWRDHVAPLKLTKDLFQDISSENAIVLHDLPAHRGEEIDGHLLDMFMPIIQEQAKAKEAAIASAIAHALHNTLNVI